MGGQPRRRQPGKAEVSQSQQGSGGHGQERFLSGSEHLLYIPRVNLRIGLIYSATVTETTARKRSKLMGLERSIQERIFPPLTQGKTWRPCRSAACPKSPRARPCAGEGTRFRQRPSYQVLQACGSPLPGSAAVVPKQTQNDRTRRAESGPRAWLADSHSPAAARSQGPGLVAHFPAGSNTP